MLSQPNIEEKILRRVILFGNGAHIFAPKDWAGEEVILSRIPEKPIEERIIEVLSPHLENIEGVFLYGSYARNEQTSESDIDILVIAENKISIKEEKYEIIVLQKENFEKAIKISPVLIYSALTEARPIINSKLLEKLRKKYKIQEKYIKEYLKQTNEIVKINEEFPSLYSLMLRLKGIYIINQLLSEKKHFSKEFESDISKNAPEVDAEKIKNYKKDYKLNKREADSLIELLKKRIKHLESRLNDKKKKTP